MGILDSIQSGLNKAAGGVGQATKKLQLNAQVNELDKKRETLLAQLGASLYEETRNDPKFRASREGLYTQLEEADIKRNELRDEIAHNLFKINHYPD